MQAGLPDFFARVVAQFETLHAQGTLTDDQLDSIKAKVTVNDVLAEVNTAMESNRDNRNAAVALIAKVTPPVVQQLERFGIVMDTLIQSSSSSNIFDCG